MKAYLVDTGSRMVFFIPAMKTYEYFAAEIKGEQLVKSAVAAVAINFVSGRIHGVAREAAKKITRTSSESSEIRKTTVETITGIAVIIASSALIYLIADVTAAQMAIAYPFAFALMCLGRPYGIFNDWVRKKSGLEPVYSTRKNEEAGHQPNL